MPIDLHSELTDLRRAILGMGAEVEQRMVQVVDALRTRDGEAAQVVRRGDRDIDLMESHIEQECLRILALSHPVAGDLRFVLAVMRINADLERIADMARGIAKRVIDLARLSPLHLPAGLMDMAHYATQMLSDAITAFSDENAALARTVRACDDRVDDLQKELFVWVQEQIPLHVESTNAMLDILSVARKLERIADVSTNIAEEVIFLCEGTMVRHTPE